MQLRGNLFANGDQKEGGSKRVSGAAEKLNNIVLRKKAILSEAYRRWREEEASVERACKTMPLTVVLWIVFVGSQLAHRHVEQGFTQNVAMDRLLNAKHPQQVNETEEDAEISDCSRRLAAAGGSSGGRGAFAEGRAAVSNGLTLLNVFNINPPNSILDWVDETALRVYWMPRNWNGDRTVVSHFNRVIGGIRLVQARASTSKCKGATSLQEYYGLSCHDDGDPAKGLINGLNERGFRASSAAGWSQDKYVYWLDIATVEELALEATQYLRDQGWMGMATSQVEVQMALYNGEITSFVYARGTFKLDRTGYLIPKLAVNTMPADVYAYTVAVVLDVLLVLTVVFLFFLQCSTLCRHHTEGKLREAIRPNLVLNLGICIVGFGLAGYFAFVNSESQTLIDELMDVPAPPETGSPSAQGGDDWALRHQKLDIFYDHIQTLVFYQDIMDVVVFWYVLALVVKFFEAFAAVPRLAVISKTLMMAAWDLVHFLLVFGLIFISYATGAFFLFGPKLKEWSSPGQALNTSFRALMGDFDFQNMYNVAPVSSTIWFWSYMVLIFLVMLNMLLAIIMDTYCEVKEQSKSNADLFTAVKDVIATYRLRRYQLVEKLEAELQESDGDFITHEESLQAVGVPKSLARHMSRRVTTVAHQLEGDEFKPMVDNLVLDEALPESPQGSTASPSSRNKKLQLARRGGSNGSFRESGSTSDLPAGQPAPPPLPPGAAGNAPKALPARPARAVAGMAELEDIDSPTLSPLRPDNAAVAWGGPAPGTAAAAWLPVQEFEQRIARLEEEVHKVITSDQKMYIIPERFSRRAIDIATSQT